MEGIEDMEEEDMMVEEEAQSPVIIMASNEIWPKISNYLLKSIVNIAKMRTMS